MPRLVMRCAHNLQHSLHTISHSHTFKLFLHTVPHSLSGRGWGRSTYPCPHRVNHLWWGALFSAGCRTYAACRAQGFAMLFLCKKNGCCICPCANYCYLHRDSISNPVALHAAYALHREQSSTFSPQLHRPDTFPTTGGAVRAGGARHARRTRAPTV